jgi:hypothetical protein
VRGHWSKSKRVGWLGPRMARHTGTSPGSKVQSSLAASEPRLDGVGNPRAGFAGQGWQASKVHHCASVFEAGNHQGTPPSRRASHRPVHRNGCMSGPALQTLHSQAPSQPALVSCPGPCLVAQAAACVSPDLCTRPAKGPPHVPGPGLIEGLGRPHSVDIPGVRTGDLPCAACSLRDSNQC